MKIFSASELQNRRRPRAQHGRKNDARRGAAARRRRDDARRAGSRKAPVRRTSTARRSSERSRSSSPSRTRSTGTYGSISSTRRATGSSLRDALRPPRPTPGPRPRRRLRGRSADGEGVEVRRRVRPARPLRRQPDGPGTRVLRARHGDPPEGFGRGVVSLQIPVRRGERLPRNGRPRPHGVPLPSTAARASTGRFRPISPSARRREHEKLVEMVAEGEDGLMEKFFAQGTLDPADLLPGLRTEVGGSQDLSGPLRVVRPRNRPRADPRRLRRHPPLARGRHGRGRPARTGSRRRSSRTRRIPAVAQIFKTISDPFAGRISSCESGPGTSSPTGPTGTRRAGSRSGSPGSFLPQGKEHVNIPEAKAGDIVAVAKLKESTTGDTLTTKEHPVVLPKLTVPEASIAYAIEPKAKGDEDKISTALHKLIEEDPSLHFQRDDETNEFHLVRRVAAPRRDRGRAPEEAVRRRGHPPPAEGPLPRDDQGQGRRARPPQEAVRRPRPVRRLQDQGRAAAARRGLRVRRRHLRRLDPAQLHPGGREGHPGGAAQGLPRRISRWSTSA